MIERGPDALRYAAFLSYSHKDANIAARLHRRLESFRMPRRLVGRDGARGPVPERLWPIFRDREELPAATDLSETVRKALAQSGALIVLCSPHAAQSLWVAEEIRTFRELHPDRPVLAAIVDGEPADSFPAALRAFGRDGTWHEPLATDLRPHADGERLGLLKLVAGITGVGLDDLVQRDASRRIRRVTAITALAVAAMLVMAVLTVAALRARAEAERQRAEAEGLVDFMLTDLRRELLGVGRVDIMSSVNERVLAYYRRFEARQGGESALAMRARIDHTIGEDLLTRGDTEAARERFERALEASAELLEKDPDDPAALFVHAQSEYWVGRVHELKGEWAEARLNYQRFADLTHDLLAGDPANADYVKRAGWAAVDLGNIQLNGLRDAEAAAQSYREAVQWFSRAARLRPDDARARVLLANAYAWLADSYYAREMWWPSLEARSRQFRIVDRLHRQDPANFEYLFRLALAQRALARSYEKVGELERARPLMHLAYSSSARLSGHDPNNAEWLFFRALAGCELLRGEFGLPAGVRIEAVRSETAAIVRRLTAQGNPNVAGLASCTRSLH